MSGFDGTAIETIELPAGLESIPMGAFSGCINLKEIKIPDTVTNLGSAVFRGCTALEKIYVSQKTLDATGLKLTRSTGEFYQWLKVESTTQGELY